MKKRKYTFAALLLSLVMIFTLLCFNSSVVFAADIPADTNIDTVSGQGAGTAESDTPEVSGVSGENEIALMDAGDDDEDLGDDDEDLGDDDEDLGDDDEDLGDDDEDLGDDDEDLGDDDEDLGDDDEDLGDDDEDLGDDDEDLDDDDEDLEDNIEIDDAPTPLAPITDQPMPVSSGAEKDMPGDVSVAETNSGNSNDNTNQSPKTGDENDLIAWLTVLILSAASLGSLRVTHRKEKNNNF